MAPRLRRIALTAHVVSSVGWLGAVGCFLALALIGMQSDDLGTARAAYIAMDAMAWVVLVPFAIASFSTGVVQSLGTRWGLFRHYWVVIKLAITVVATVVLLLYTETLAHFADAATSRAADVAGLQTSSPVLHSAAALVLLLAATSLAVFKPRGMTRHGWRKSLDERGDR